MQIDAFRRRDRVVPIPRGELVGANGGEESAHRPRALASPERHRVAAAGDVVVGPGAGSAPVVEEVGDRMARMLQWTPQQRTESIERYRKDVERSRQWRNG